MVKLILFDVDGTLVRWTGTKGTHFHAFSHAFNQVYGVKTTVDIINIHGMTDQQIITEVMKKNGISEQQIKSKMKECMEVMIHYYNASDEKPEVIEGVRELLQSLEEHHILMGLVTGNLEPIARGKLKRCLLDHFFRVGGFGSDSVKRADLVRIAIKRARNEFGLKQNINAFLIGDTPLDMKAGIEVGAITIGVSTGSYSGNALAKAGADFVLKDLTNIQSVLEILGL